MSTVPNQKDSSTPGASESSTLLGETVVVTSEPEMKLGKCWDSSRRLQVDILAGLFGVSAWLSVNAMFTQLPIMVQSAPEGWKLPSYLSILIQMANIGPILFSLSRKYCPTLIPDSKLIYFLLFLGSSSLILMAFYYDATYIVAGQSHSVVLFILTFCIALVGCTSSVVFIPFMNHYPEQYIISYMVGEGISGFLPSLIALVQGVGGNPSCMNSTTPSGEVIIVPHRLPPRFYPGLFFMIIFSVMAVSTISFFLLNNLPSCKAEKVRKPSVRRRSLNDAPELDMYLEPEPLPSSPDSQIRMTSVMYKSLLIMQAILSMFANGVLPSMQSYSCLPYGNVAYHLAVNLSHIASPTACFLAYFVPYVPYTWIFSLFLLCWLPICYVFTTAFLSPVPPLQGSDLGVTLVVLTWIICSGLISYVKMAIMMKFRLEGVRGLFRYGGVTQVGAAIGSGVMFYLINHVHIFTSYNPCR